MATLPTPTVMTNFHDFFKLLSKGVFWPLLACICSCHTPQQPWKLEIIKATPKCDSIRRWYYSSPDPFCNLQLEILESRTSLRIFINVFSLGFTACDSDASIPVKFSSPNEEQIFSAYVYRGGQRLLLPSYCYSWIIENLQQGNPLNLNVGRYSIILFPNSFPKRISYQWR
jgi:hypothetical protein